MIPLYAESMWEVISKIRCNIHQNITTTKDKPIDQILCT